MDLVWQLIICCLFVYFGLRGWWLEEEVKRLRREVTNLEEWAKTTH